jgi:quinol monooxygenase YgiN
MHVATVALLVHRHKRHEALSAIEELMRRMRAWPGCIGCRLLTDATNGDNLTLISEWQQRRELDGFLGSHDFLILKGMRMLLRQEPEAVLDEIVTRKSVPFNRALG